MLSSSEPDNWSPTRSRSAIRSRSRRLLRRVASRAMMTIPSTDPDGCRSGIAWARTNTRDASARMTAKVPSPALPRSTCRASSATFPASPPVKPRVRMGWPSSFAASAGKPNSATANGLAYSRLPCRSVTTTAAPICPRMAPAGRWLS